MPQTITLQRGQISASSSSTNLVFTNSASPIATRMVPGYLGVKLNSADTGLRCVFGVRRSGASAGSECVFAIADSQGSFNSTDGFSFSPHDTANQLMGVGGGSTSTQSQAIWQGGLNAYGFYFGSSTPNAYVALKHNNVIIGPSDEIYVYFQSSAGTRTATIQYCFTLITES